MNPKSLYVVILLCGLVHFTIIGLDTVFFHTFRRDGEVIYQVSQAVAYLLYPLLGWIADVYFTRYKFVIASFIHAHHPQFHGHFCSVVFIVRIFTAIFVPGWFCSSHWSAWSRAVCTVVYSAWYGLRLPQSRSDHGNCSIQYALATQVTGGTTAIYPSIVEVLATQVVLT